MSTTFPPIDAAKAVQSLEEGNRLTCVDVAAYQKLVKVDGPRFVVFTGSKDGSPLESWCPDCSRAMPIILSAAADAGLPLTVVGVGSRDDWKLDARGSENPLRAKDGLALTGVPTLQLIGKDGTEVGRVGSELEEEEDPHKLMALVKEACFKLEEPAALKDILASSSRGCLRIFVAGAVTHVGKTTVCLSILAALRRAGLKASELAYIKPATQCEAPDLLGKWCAAEGIEYVAGEQAPLVFYSGFTRSFLDGEQGTSAQWIEKITTRVDALAVGRRVVLVDGVGFPAVGSVVGVDNAEVAKAARAPVLLVCKSGVGAAIDSFSLNSTYFLAKGVPVLGAVFNHGALDGFYSWDKCKDAIERWFAAPSNQRQSCYGVVPFNEMLSDLRERIEDTEEHKLGDLANLNATHFASHVDIAAIVRDASADPWNRVATKPSLGTAPPTGTTKNSAADFKPPSRDAVVAAAKAAGARGGG